CGSEYALQAAALHGALVGGGRPQPAGRLVALRLERISVSRLDDPALGTLAIEAFLEWADPTGAIYRFRVGSEHRMVLLEGRGTILFAASGG
ncbi:MAG: phosphotransferase, partial [Acetobacteraceae bacterium]